ncbi:hypothetical protein [Inquilinus sp. OTU3971]|uniref:hypothetical protein n=1 Tax=Inquilinus sp. OTU3971 TaxID=3043855 RepID=UPI00313F0D7D
MVGLDEFIAGVLTAIVRGIKQGQASDVGDHVAPLISGHQRNDYGNFHLKGDGSNQATIVQFDVQVATESASEGTGTGKGSFRLYVVDIEIGAGGKAATKSSAVHRLQFAIPLKIPVTRSSDRLAGAQANSDVP